MRYREALFNDFLAFHYHIVGNKLIIHFVNSISVNFSDEICCVKWHLFVKILIWIFYLIYFNFIKLFFLQCCVGFCHTTVQIIHNYTYNSFFPNLSPHPTFHPSMSSQCTRLGSLCYTAIHLTSNSAYKVGATFFIHPTLCHPQIQNMKLFICH